MALSIISNQAASIATRSLGQSNEAATATAEKLSSGKRINSAKDDAAASAIAARLSAEVAGLQQASTNASQASSMLQIADGAFQNVEDILTRAKSLSVQAGSEQISDQERAFLDQEFQALKTEIDRIADDTEFNGTKLVNAGVAAQANLTAASATLAGVETVNGMLGSVATSGGNDFAGGPGFNAAAFDGFNVNGVDLVQGAAVTTAGNEVLGGAQTGAFMVAVTGATTTTNAAASNIASMVQFQFDANVMTTGGGTNVANFTAMFTFTMANNIGTGGAASSTMTGPGNAFTLNANGDIGLASNAMIQLAATDADGTIAVTLNSTAALASGATGAGTQTGDVLLAGDTSANFIFKVGTGTVDTEDEISVDIGSITTDALGIASASITDKASADDASEVVSTAIDTLQEKRSEVGAAQNRLDFAGQNVELTRENQEAARSELEDLNVAKAITEFSQQQLLVQAGTSTLSQANSLPQNLLQLFR